MPDRPNILLKAAEWLPAGQWERASDRIKRRWLEAVGELAVARKRSELRRGIGVDGRKLHPVSPRSRPDGATGPPLTPHRGMSRTVRNLRHKIGLKGGTVTLYWLGRVGRTGWGTILLYHAQGVVIGTYLRDVLGLTKASMRRLKGDARRLWRRLMGSVPKPPDNPVQVPHRARRPVRRGRLPLAARPGMFA